MTKLEKKLRESLRRLGIVEHRHAKSQPSLPSIVVAVSGGADSTALLDALARLHNQDGWLMNLIAAHLNHQLRGAESDEDEQFIRELAERLGLPLFVERIAIADQAQAARRNLEATARQFRYEFLRDVGARNHADYAFTAHTQDDQAETILMRLLRGTGAEGLHGVHEVRPLAENIKLVRPLLAVTRAEVIAHCEHHGLPFRSDSSNLSMDFMRNRVRHELLPLLRTFNPQIDTVLTRTSELLAEDDTYLHEVADDQLASLGTGAALPIPRLVEQPPAIRRRILRLWLKAQRGDLRRINYSHIKAIEELMAPDKSGHRMKLPDGGIVLREYDKLRLLGLDQTVSLNMTDAVPLVAGTLQSFGAFTFKLLRHLSRKQAEQILVRDRSVGIPVLLRESKELDGMLLRVRKPGDAYLAMGHSRRTKLKTLMIRHKIPVSQRATYPVLVTKEGEIVWVPGLPVAQRFSTGAEDAECALALVEELGMV